MQPIFQKIAITTPTGKSTAFVCHLQNKSPQNCQNALTSHWFGKMYLFSVERPLCSSPSLIPWFLKEIKHMTLLMYESLSFPLHLFSLFFLSPCSPFPVVFLALVPLPVYCRDINSRCVLTKPPPWLWNNPFKSFSLFTFVPVLLCSVPPLCWV